jgi:hypothetical protein
MKKQKKIYWLIGGAIALILLLSKKRKPLTTMITETNQDENFKNFLKITDLVIQKLEGGYFHPNMRTKDPEKFGAYHRSGETMFGLDRHAGHDLYYSDKRKSDDVLTNLKFIPSYKYKNRDSAEFWGYIDNVGAKNNWKWNSKPTGETGNALRLLASKIIYPKFISNFNAFLTPEARSIVFNSPPLMFHFSYATWNGSGWFKKFASDINEAIKKGITDEKSLIKIAINSRTKEGLKKGSPANKLIKQGGDKIATFINTITF